MFLLISALSTGHRLPRKRACLQSHCAKRGWRKPFCSMPTKFSRACSAERTSAKLQRVKFSAGFPGTSGLRANCEVWGNWIEHNRTLESIYRGQGSVAGIPKCRKHLRSDASLSLDENPAVDISSRPARETDELERQPRRSGSEAGAPWARLAIERLCTRYHG
jgi:hypothetical protein